MARRKVLRLDDFLPYLINRVGFALVASYSRVLAPHRLSIDMWRVLAALSNSGGQRQIDLVTMTSIDASTMSRLVTRLVQRGLVTRSRSATSNREVKVELSPRGRATVGELIPVALELEATAIAGLPDNELAAVKEALRAIYGNLARRRDGGT